MSLAVPSWVPEQSAVIRETGRAGAVAVTLLVLGESLQFAAATATLFIVVRVAAAGVQRAVGDYADHVWFGLLVLAGTIYILLNGGPLAVGVAGLAVGGWLVIDGVQHLRHGVSRDDVTVPYTHQGSVVTGLPRVLLARLLAPFRL